MYESILLIIHYFIIVVFINFIYHLLMCKNMNVIYSESILDIYSLNPIVEKGSIQISKNNYKNYTFPTII